MGVLVVLESSFGSSCDVAFKTRPKTGGIGKSSSLAGQTKPHSDHKVRRQKLGLTQFKTSLLLYSPCFHILAYQSVASYG